MKSNALLFLAKRVMMYIVIKELAVLIAILDIKTFFLLSLIAPKIEKITKREHPLRNTRNPVKFINHSLKASEHFQKNGTPSERVKKCGLP